MQDRYQFTADKASIKVWYDTWGDCVARVDFVAARPLFADDVLGFGTFVDFVEGRERLETNQWCSIWPTIKNFRFQTERLRVSVSPDRRQAVGMVIWESTGFDEGKHPYARPGRASAVLVRETLDQPWLGIHTHFSVFPRTPPSGLDGSG